MSSDSILAGQVARMLKVWDDLLDSLTLTGERGSCLLRGGVVPKMVVFP